MKKTTALLLLGLVTATVLHAEEPMPLLSAPTGTPSGRLDLQKIKTGDDYVTLNFTNIDITALVKVMSELTRRNFVLDERVTGKVTLMTPTKITPDEAYQVFLSALEIKGFTAVEDGKVVRIILAATARQSGLKVFRDDVFKGEGFATKLVRLTYVNPNDIVRTLTPLVSKDGSLLAYPATSSLIITDAVYNIRKIESLIRALDIPAPEGKGKINVYYLKNANAEDFSKVMSALVSRLPVPSAGGAAQPAGPSTILEGQVNITSDKATNSLIIVASPGDYETIKDVIQKLDIRRRQVYVEAAIIEMSLTKMRDLGFEFLYAPQQIQSGPGAPTTPLGGTNFGNIGSLVASGPAALANINGLAVGAIKGTFKYNDQTFLNIGALLHALQVDGDVNVLSTPNLLTMDNQKAEIMVGQNVPFQTGQTQNAVTGGQALFNTFERQDVGIKLSLTPQISSDDNVRLEIKQEISDVVASTSANVGGPTTNKRSASTTVVVKDGQTMVIGGLIRDNVTSSTSKVPFLGDIPLLGWLFKSKTTSIDKTNLMIFITPYIIKNETEAAEITKKKSDALDAFRKEYRIEKKGSEPVLPTLPAPSQQKPDQKTGAVESKGAAAPALQTAPTGSAAAIIQSAPTGTTQVPALQTAPTGTTAVLSAPTGTAQPAPAEVVR